jgi:hypothetical protein
MSLNIKHFDLRDDSAENSIMQTITIAVSAILIAAGLVTAPGLINNARDNNATGDLANVAYSEEFSLANDGVYRSAVQPGDGTDSLADLSKKVDGAPHYTLSPDSNVKAVTCTNGQGYLLKASSRSAKTFYRSSESASTSTTVGTGASDVKVPACLTATVVDELMNGKATYIKAGGSGWIPLTGASDYTADFANGGATSATLTSTFLKMVTDNAGNTVTNTSFNADSKAAYPAKTQFIASTPNNINIAIKSYAIKIDGVTVATGQDSGYLTAYYYTPNVPSYRLQLRINGSTADQDALKAKVKAAETTAGRVTIDTTIQGQRIIFTR